VGRLDDHVIVVGEDDVVERAMHVVGVGNRVLLAEQVRPTDGADQQRAAAHQEGRIRSPARVGDRVGDVLGGVAGRVPGREAECADVERRAVAKRAMLMAEIRSGTDDVGRAGQCGQLAAARDVVVVEMGLDDVRDPDVELACGLQVRVHVPARVHDGGHAGRIVGDQRRQVAETLDPEQPRQHPIERSTTRPALGLGTRRGPTPAYSASRLIRTSTTRLPKLTTPNPSLQWRRTPPAIGSMVIPALRLNAHVAP